MLDRNLAKIYYGSPKLCGSRWQLGLALSIVLCAYYSERTWPQDALPKAKSVELNEPVIDPETVKEVLVTIQDLAEDGMTCILVTHEMGFAREVANHIYFTDRGVIVEHGPPESFFTNAKDPRTQEFLSQIL